MAEPIGQSQFPAQRRLKICFVGNTNNYPFLVAMAMRRMGHEVTVMLDRTESLHRPQGRYPEFTAADTDWVRDISHEITGDRWTLSRSAELTTRQLGRYDLLVLNGFGLALAGGRGVPVFAMLTGSDLTHLANWGSIGVLWRDLRSLGLLRRLLACALHARTVGRQRRAIRHAFGASYFVRGVVPEADRLLDGLGVEGGRRTSFMLSDIDHIRPQPQLDQGGADRPLRIFNVARLNWCQPKPAYLSELDMKGTDILLQGLAAYLRQSKVPAQLVLVRKGVDIEATRREVERLGLVDCVTWLDEMSQSEVFEQYAMADVVTEQLSTSYLGMGGLDAMAAGRPVIANTRPDARGDGLLREEAPVLHAQTPQDVCRHLLSLSASRGLIDELGQRARAYVEEWHSPLAAARRILGMYAAAQRKSGVNA